MVGGWLAGAAVAGRLPDFLIIGAGRSGTTSLARYMGAHPDVFMAPQKEVHFFDRYFSRGVDWYRQQFSGARMENVVGEATPAYLWARTAPRMAHVLPDARLIAILRNPVDRAYSHYWNDRELGREPLEFAEAVGPALRGSPGQDSVRYLEEGRYLPQLLDVCRHYRREQLLVLLFENLLEDPMSAQRAASRFVGIDDDFTPSNLGQQINAYRSYRSRSLRMYTRRGRKTFLKRVLGRMNVRRQGSYPPMDPALRHDLLAWFREENRALAAWLGRDSLPWNE